MPRAPVELSQQLRRSRPRLASNQNPNPLQNSNPEEFLIPKPIRKYLNRRTNDTGQARCPGKQNLHIWLHMSPVRGYSKCSMRDGFCRRDRDGVDASLWRERRLCRRKRRRVSQFTSPCPMNSPLLLRSWDVKVVYVQHECIGKPDSRRESWAFWLVCARESRDEHQASCDAGDEYYPPSHGCPG